MLNNEKLLAVDLFSGAGGLSLGFLQTGQVHVVAAVENNKSAQKTYVKNHKDVRIFNDIKGLKYNEIIEECEKMGRDRVNIVFGGPPCQGFSNANRQKTELISTNNQLVKEYVNVIERLNPDAFVMENVKAMKSSKHKFFYSTTDDKELLDLEITPLTERIALGKETMLTEELILFLKENIREESDLSKYILKDKNVFLRLRQLGRKEKDFNAYLVKIQQDISKVLSKWEEQHQESLYDSYSGKWITLREQLQNKYHSDSSNEELRHCLNEIIEIQKILMRMNEIMSNNIEIINIITENKNVLIEVKTYGVLQYIKAKFKKLGYILNEDQLILNAAQFGAPQLRERLFLIGIKSEFAGNNIIELPKPIINDPNQFYTVKDAIADLEGLEPHTLMVEDKPMNKLLCNNFNPLAQYLNGNVKVVNNHIMTETRQTALDRFGMIEPGQNFHHLDERYKQTYSNPGRTQNTVYQRLRYDTPSGTVLNVRKSMWIHPKKIRAISIREAARIQTFPDDFIFEGQKDSQYQQIGNAVPPLLGRAVAEKVLSYLGKTAIEPLSSFIRPLETAVTFSK